MDKLLFTSESVTCGHPDKVCDQVADKILDELLVQDPYSRVACEVTCAENQMHIFGESTSNLPWRAIFSERYTASHPAAARPSCSCTFPTSFAAC